MEHRTTGIIALRLLLGFALLKDFITFYSNRAFIFDHQGIVSYETYQDIVQYYQPSYSSSYYLSSNLGISFF
ncbi:MULTISPECIES: hypothetical protein [unclassified Myroides]|uniref:hypothetical protein n=1 Tax=unclassified Myroides TaxID=2642485 RepID=UPI002577F9F5|nr:MULTISPECIES: hypothetical protein [unclassified Myroides]